MSARPPADRAAVFAAVFATLYAAHTAVDHWGQSDYQAATKGQRNRAGRHACARHALTHAAGSAAALAVMARATGLRASVPHAAVGVAFSAVTHYWADRRFTLARLADLTGKGGFYRLGAPRPGRDDNPSLGTGAYALDQSFHISMLFLASLLAAAPARRQVAP